MSVISLKDFINIHDIMRTDTAGPNTITAQVGDVVNATGGQSAEWWQHIGFASRPSKVSGTGNNSDACQAVSITRSDYDIVVASRDTRFQEIYGLLKDGETCLYATGPTGTAQGRHLIKQDGSINMYTTNDNTETGRSVYFRVSPTGFKWVAPWGTMKFDDTGFHVLHSSGASFDLGGLYGIPGTGSPPLNQFTSYATTSAGMVSNSTPGKPLASAPDTILAFVAQQTQITALQAEIALLNVAIVAMQADSIAFKAGLPATVLTAAPSAALPTYAVAVAAVTAATAAVVTATAAIATGAATVAAENVLIPTSTSSI